MFKLKKSTKKNIAVVVKITCIMLILSFFIFSMIVGGNAGLGYEENGKYFVGNHGDFSEVSETVWVISYVLEMLFWISVPLTIISEYFIVKFKEKNES